MRVVGCAIDVNTSACQECRSGASAFVTKVMFDLGGESVAGQLRVVLALAGARAVCVDGI